jgi:HEAT repeat protein
MKDFEKLDETPVDFADEIVRSVLSIDDPKQLVGQTDKLKSLIRHPKPDVRKAAYWALGRTGDFGLIPLMLEGVKDPDVDVNVEAIAALRYIARKPNGLGESLNPLDGVPENDTAQRIRAAVDWRQKTIKLWSNWYASVRPYEEIGSFDELQLAVPVDSGAK